MTREEIKKLIEKSIKGLQRSKELPKFDIPEIQLEKPEEKNHGDYATNIALVIGKTLKQNPIEIAGKLKYKIQDTKCKTLDAVEVAGPGFINFFLSKGYLQRQVKEVLKKKNNFGELKIGRGKRLNVEFISANPTGPLTLGNGRGGFCGDTLANILTKAGFKTEREYYINDTGEQVRKLGHSVLGDSEAVYRGDYIEDLRKKIKGKNAEEIGEKAAKIIMKEMIKPMIKKMKIKFDTWSSEKTLYRKKETEKVLSFLKRKGLSYKKDGALWFKSTEFGDDKDRVLIKDGGEPTYFLSDTAYLKNKFKRGFKTLFFFWGADHFGYVNRIKAAAEALGFDKENIRIVIMQLVRLIQRGKEIKMSKRTGTYVVLDELVNEVGLDVARFFFLTRSPDTHLNFDLDLAKEQSEKNPIYYVQYAHARICSILKKRKGRRDFVSSSPSRALAKGEEETLVSSPSLRSGTKSEKLKITAKNLKLIKHPSELNLIKQLIRFPEIVEDTAKDYQVQRLPQYATDLATAFHQFYRDCRVISENKELTKARLGLILATKIVLKNTLDLMGISAPEKM